MARKSQQKSRSKVRRNPGIPLSGPFVVSDGTREIAIDELSMAMLEEQKQAFREKFGRDPGPGDPVFFDTDMDVPKALSEAQIEQMRTEVIRSMEESGLPPAIIHAYRRTGLLVTNVGLDTLSEEDLAEWDEALKHYETCQRMAEDARKGGVHPAIVYAISRTGKAWPDDLEISPDRSSVRGSDDDVEWIEAVVDYIDKHPGCRPPDLKRLLSRSPPKHRPN
jgi:hypothetical protein